MPSGQIKTFTITFAAYGLAGQVQFTVQAPNRERAFAIARQALHTSADSAPLTITG